MTNRPGDFAVEWIDQEREPKLAPNPAYPNGIAIDLAQKGARACSAALPYPAKRIGLYLVECRECRYRVGITTAGRRDDPNAITLPCYGGNP
jgi:hypothetical protein